MTEFFADLRELVSMSILHMPGGERSRMWRNRRYVKSVSGGKNIESMLSKATDEFDNIVSEERTDILRWCLVLAITFHMHTRLLDEAYNFGVLTREKKWLVDWDRWRMRHLMTSTEFEELDWAVRSLAEPQELWNDLPFEMLDEGDGVFDGGPSSDVPRNNKMSTMPMARMPMLVIYKINTIILKNLCPMKSMKKRSGIAERFIPYFGTMSRKLLTSFQLVTQCVSTPLPFPYFHLCKTLLFMYFVCFPFFIQRELGIFANVCEFSGLALALTGVDAIATELENPFGDDDNDLDMYERISMLESECLTCLELAGDKRAIQNFMWIDMPEPIASQSIVPISQFLSLQAVVESDGDQAIFVGGQVKRTEEMPVELEFEEEEEDASSASGSS